MGRQKSGLISCMRVCVCVCVCGMCVCMCVCVYAHFLLCFLMGVDLSFASVGKGRFSSFNFYFIPLSNFLFIILCESS